MIFVATSCDEWAAKSMDRLIHRSAWKRCSANFALTEFSEVSVASANTCGPPGSRRPDFQRAPLGSVGSCDGHEVHTTPLPYGAGHRCHLSRLDKHSGPPTAGAHF